MVRASEPSAQSNDPSHQIPNLPPQGVRTMKFDKVTTELLSVNVILRLQSLHVIFQI
jgi:hypothetical protein